MYFLQNDDQVQAQAEQQDNNAQRPPSRFESFISVTRTLIIRALIIYFITNFFRKQTPTTPPAGESGQPGQARLPASNFFPNGTLFVSKIHSSFK